MAKIPSGSKEPQKKQVSSEDRFEEIKKDPQFPDFIKQLVLTNSLKSDDVDSLPLRQQREIVNKFWAWKQAGAPGLQMAHLAFAKPVVQKVYRIKHLGKQFLAFIGNKGKEGITDVVTYGQKQVTDPETHQIKFIEDKDNIIKKEPKYTIPYTESKARELMDMALETSVSPTFYFLRGKRKIQVTNHENFFGEFDSLMEKADEGRVI